jgi:hypothetical protein
VCEPVLRIKGGHFTKAFRRFDGVTPTGTMIDLGGLGTTLGGAPAAACEL